MLFQCMSLIVSTNEGQLLYQYATLIFGTSTHLPETDWDQLWSSFHHLLTKLDDFLSTAMEDDNLGGFIKGMADDWGMLLLEIAGLNYRHAAFYRTIPASLFGRLTQTVTTAYDKQAIQRRQYEKWSALFPTNEPVVGHKVAE